MKKKKAAKAKKPAAKRAKAKKPAAKKGAAKAKAKGGRAPWQAEGYAAVTPYLTVIDVAKALDFYERAFGFARKTAMPGPGGKIVHGEVTVGDMRIMMGLPNPAQGDKAPAAFGGTPVSLYVYVPDVDAAFERARAAGATSHLSPTDMFWGDRIASLEDPEGHRWTLATHVRTLSPAEMRKAMEAMSGGGAPSHEHVHEHGGTAHDHDHGHGDGHGHAHEESRPSHS